MSHNSHIDLDNDLDNHSRPSLILNHLADDRKNSSISGDDSSYGGDEDDNEVDNDNGSNDIRKTRSNVSELSRFISGIRDDINHDDNYRETALADRDIADQLEKVSRVSTATSRHYWRDAEMGGSRTRSGSNQLSRTETDPQTPADGIIEGEDDSRNDEEDDDDNDEKEEFQNGPPPDTGYSWIVAICAMLMVFSTWGSNAGYGVFLNFYINNGTFAGATNYDFALIGGIVVFLAQFLAPYAALAYKVLGIKITCTIGIIMQFVGYILASFATKLWHLYCTQGLIVGISFSLLFIPSTLVLPTWFDKHRSLAFGITVSGAGVGGVTFSLTVNKLIDTTGDQKWALRFTAFLTLVISAFALIFLKPRNQKRVPFSVSLTKGFVLDNLGLIFDKKVFKLYPLVVLGTWYLVCMLGYVVMLFSMSSYATLVGLPASEASILTAVLNVGQAVGRPCFGLVADRFGRVNVTSSACLLIAVLIWAFWINAVTYAALVPFALLIGAIIGVGSIMCQPIASDIIDEASQLPAAWSGLNILVLLSCLVAEVIALALYKPSASHPYLHTQIFVGFCFFGGVLLMIVIREYLVRKVFNYRLTMAHTRIKELTTAKGRYLKISDQDNEELEIIQERLQRFETLLQTNIRFYIIRTFYPIKV